MATAKTKPKELYFIIDDEGDLYSTDVPSVEKVKQHLMDALADGYSSARLKEFVIAKAVWKPKLDSVELEEI